MKILITGEKSYVGNSLKTWLSQWPNKYNVDFISLRNDEWKNKDISKYDTLFHVAAVVHKKEQSEIEDLYYKINSDLTVELATKAKQSGIKQFIFMSSASVYGLVGHIDRDLIINKDTPCHPNTFYGKSKLRAEIALKELEDRDFRVAIIRAPLVYGPNCPGNYAQLRKLVMNVSIFPSINNTRSMLYIDNLSEFVRLIVDNRDHGLFFPQNKHYVNTAELVRLIAINHSKKVYLSETLAFGLKIFGKKLNVLNKVFGNLCFDMELSSYRNFQYCIADLESSIHICEAKFKDSMNRADDHALMHPNYMEKVL